MFSRIGTLYLSREYKPHFCIESLLADALSAAKLVSPDYLSAKPKDPDAVAESWRQFFAKLGVRVSPAIEAEGRDWRCSIELQALLDSPTPAVRKATLECLSTHWSDYAEYLSYPFQVSRYSQVSKDTAFALSLRATQAPTKKRTTVQLEESYYPSPELKTLLGDSLPYIDAVLTESMLDACHVTYRLDAKALVKRLKQLRAEDGGTTKQVQGIYRALDERLWDSSAAYIKQAFSQDGLIQIKGAHKGWFKPSEVAWRSNSVFLDSLYPPIQSLYRDFSKFFVDKLGIPRELPTGKWVEALTSLDTVENPEERKAEALAIYRRANRDLGPKFGREVQAPEWVETFQTEAVYIDQRGEIVPNDGYLFANDDDAIAALFVDEDDLSFLAVPSQEVPRFSRLLELADVSRLSDSITRDVSNADSGIVDEDLTTRVHHSVQFFARVLYAKRPDVFELALDDGRFASLRDFEVARVPQVDILVSIGNYSRETTADIALSKNRVLYRAGARSVKDMLAAELSKFLGASTDLADTFARILMESETDSIEDFLRLRNFGALPSDLLEALYNSAGPPDEDGTDGASMEQPEGEQEPTLDETSAATEREAERVLSGDKQPKDAGLASPPTPAETPSGGSGVRGTAPGSQRTPSQETVPAQSSAPSHAPRASALPPGGGSPTPSSAATSRTSPSTEGTQGHSGPGGTPGAAGSGEAGSQGSGLPLQAPLVTNKFSLDRFCEEFNERRP